MSLEEIAKAANEKATPSDKMAGIIGGGIGLSSAAVIFMFMTFQTKTDADARYSQIDAKIEKVDSDRKESNGELKEHIKSAIRAALFEMRLELKDRK